MFTSTYSLNVIPVLHSLTSGSFTSLQPKSGTLHGELRLVLAAPDRQYSHCTGSVFECEVTWLCPSPVLAVIGGGSFLQVIWLPEQTQWAKVLDGDAETSRLRLLCIFSRLSPRLAWHLGGMLAHFKKPSISTHPPVLHHRRRRICYCWPRAEPFKKFRAEEAAFIKLKA